VVGRWTGSGGGKNLMFNGHMDTSNTGREEFLTGIGYKPQAVVKNGFVYGLGIYNMKGALVCYIHAVKALQRAGVRLHGDVIVAAVAGEIEKTQWGEFSGKDIAGTASAHTIWLITACYQTCAFWESPRTCMWYSSISDRFGFASPAQAFTCTLRSAKARRDELDSTHA